MSTLVRRFARSLPWVRSALPAAFALMMLALSNVLLNGQTATPAQAAQAQLGDGAGLFRFEQPLAYGADEATSARDALASLPGIDLTIRAFDFPIEGLPDGVDYLEASWPGPLDSNYTLDEGRLPEAPGEVVLVNFRDGPAVGQSLDVLGGQELVSVVGTASGDLTRRRTLLAAPGTWGLMKSPSTALAQVSGQASLLFADPTSVAAAQTAATAVGEKLFKQAQPEAQGTFVSVASAAGQAPEPWIDRSPILFWFPGLVLVAAAAYLTYAGLTRTLVPAISVMRRTGVATSVAVSAPWLAVLSRIGPGAVVGWGAGWVIGWIVGPLVARRWGYPSPQLSWPSEAALISVLGISGGAFAAWYSLRSRVLPARPVADTAVSPSGAGGRLASVAAVGLSCIAVYLVVAMRSPWQMLSFVCICVTLAALTARRATRTVAAWVPTKRLSGRLMQRLIATYLLRTASFVAVLTLGLGLTAAIAVSVQSAVAADRINQGSTAPPGFVALDSDDAPALPVPPEVTAAAERVDALRRQTPIQLWATGRAVESDSGVVDLEDTVSVKDAVVPIFVVSTVSDFETISRSQLSTEQANLFERGGLLLVQGGESSRPEPVELFDVATGTSVGTFAANHATVRPAPWLVGTPGFLLKKTALAHGMAVSPGATIYTDVSAPDAARVQQELTLDGIHPENAEIYYKLPPVLPDVALIVGCAAIFAMIVGVAALLARSQVQGMRTWVDQLRRLGVPTGWARRVLLGQYVVLVVTGLTIGAIAGLGAILIAKVRLPGMVIEVPWTIVGLGAGATVAACLTSVVTALRLLGRTDPLAREFGFE